ncbi:MAG: SUMF1/EgtB/PvdO family nonheme iron enzyme, partial [Bacteroidales bacterium]|nr:SUMF1/EgtB/PvdO family nonheme iron enzyme [Bacteroidales bacterium]
MKKLILIGLVAVLVLSGCSSTGNGELIGVQKREKWFEPDPYGMVKVPMGSFVVGPQDEDITFSMNATSKTISVDAFWMDETEITNNEYRQFVHWVIDSMAREKLGDEYDADMFLISEDQYGNPIEPPFLNWDARINPKQEEVADVLEQFYIPENERFFRRKELDTRKLIYEYQDIDYKAAARERKNPQRQIMNSDKSEVYYSDSVLVSDRSKFVKTYRLNIYP